MSDAAMRMDLMYRRQRHIYDLTRKPYLLGRDRLIEGLAPPPGGSVIELGCGTARNLIIAALRYPGRRFYGVDASMEMLTTAAQSVANAGLSDQIRLAQADVLEFDAARCFGVPRFDRVALSYTLSMIPDWRGALGRAVSLAGATGETHVVDFGDGAGLPRPALRALRAWLALFDVTPRADLVACAEASAGGRTVRSEALWRGYARHLVIAPSALARGAGAEARRTRPPARRGAARRQGRSRPLVTIEAGKIPPKASAKCRR
jgi:S-adenosylmethionine-diacylgycerolhomoserine-N-methlytransferase